MIIEINQCLHGYQNGHQLLSSSIELSPEDRKILLFQSDLSGSGSIQGFESYITGYPLSNGNCYAFAKTWYAEEMKRPGCVWTHTLLVDFADLGKIPNLNILTSFFRRPGRDLDISYDAKLEVSLEHDFKHNNLAVDTDKTDNIKIQIIKALYENPAKTVIIASKTTNDWDVIFMNIWSDQWPRLRRQFYFCTGAISLKTLDSREFDLQVIPEKNLGSIERLSNKLYLLNQDEGSLSKWINILKDYPQDQIRKFLWTYGSDIDGKRGNYIPLLIMFDILNNSKFNIKDIAPILSKYFPSAKEANLLKSKIFHAEAPAFINYDERQIIEYLLKEQNIDFLEGINLDLEKRLIKLFNANKIDSISLYNIWNNALPNRVTQNFWFEIDLSRSDALNLIKQNDEAIDVILEFHSNLINDKKLWKLPYEIQSKALAFAVKNEIWTKVIDIILDVQSPIIIDLFKYKGTKVILLSLDWLNFNNKELSFRDDWAKMVLRDNSKIFKSWVRANESHVNSNVFKAVFSTLHHSEISSVGFSYDTYIKFYRELQKEQSPNLIYVACVILTIGLDNALSGSEFLVSETFDDVFNHAQNSIISPSNWQIIPKDFDGDLENRGDNLFSILFGRSLKKANGVLDPKDILIRTLCSKFIKYSWQTQSFAYALKSKNAFFLAICYCLGSKKGMRFLERAIKDFNSRKVKLNGDQIELVNQYLK